MPLRRVDSLTAADVVVLPGIWTCYATCRERLDEAAKVAELAARQNKPLIVWHAGDHRPRLPFSHYVLFLTASNRSSRAAGDFPVPAFIKDPLALFNGGRPLVREKQDVPTVGFCGYATTNVFRAAYAAMRNTSFRMRHVLGDSEYEPPEIYPPARWRALVLAKLAKHSRVRSHIIKRRSHKAGVRRADPTHATVLEFFRNILDTDYTICMRGYGNWSLRLYETLACGRIPVLIDTDGSLPFDGSVDWKRYCVWVPEREWRSAADRILEFHAALTPEQFVEKQTECRRFWEDRLSFSGFFRHFDEYLGKSGLLRGHDICPPKSVLELGSFAAPPNGRTRGESPNGLERIAMSLRGPSSRSR